MLWHRISSIIMSLLLIAPTTSPAATTVYRDPGRFFAALAATVVRTEDYETTTLGTIISPGTVLNGISYGFSDGRSGRIGNDFNNIGSRGLYPAGVPNFFDAGQSFSVTFAAPVRAVGGYFNVAPSASNVLKLTAAGVTADGGGPDDAADLTTFYFLGIISTASFVTATFGAEPNAASGFNFDNLVYSVAPSTPIPPSTPAVPENATWLMMLTGFAIVGAAQRRMRRASFAPVAG